MRWQHWLYTAPLRFRSVFRRAQVEQELEDELQFHIERQMREEIAAGRTAKEARHAALRSVDRLELRKEECRDMRRVSYIEHFMQDLQYAVRLIRRSPGFATVAVLSLALGVGLNSSVFSVLNALLLRPLAAPPIEIVRPRWIKSRCTVPGDAPNAIRMPISGMLRLTTNASTPYSPTALSARPSIAKVESRPALNSAPQ